MSKLDEAMNEVLEHLGGLQEEIGKVKERINKILYPDMDRVWDSKVDWLASSKLLERRAKMKAEDAKDRKSELEDWVEGRAEGGEDIEELRDMPSKGLGERLGERVKGTVKDDDQNPLELEYQSTLIKNNPENPELYSNRAWSYSLMNNFAQAIKDYDMAIKLDSESADYLLGRAQARKSWSLEIAGRSSISDYRQTYKDHLTFALMDIIGAVKILPTMVLYREAMEIIELLRDICKEEG